MRDYKSVQSMTPVALDRYTRLLDEADNLWAKRDALTDEAYDYGMRVARDDKYAEMQGEIEQMALAARILEAHASAIYHDPESWSHDPQNSESILSLTDRAAAEQDERFAAAVRQFADGELDRAIDILDRAGEAIDELTKDEITEALYDVDMELPDECGLQFTDGELADAMEHNPSDSVKQAWELSRDDRSFRFAPERNVPSFAFRDYVTRKVTAGID